MSCDIINHIIICITVSQIFVCGGAPGLV